MGKRVRISNGSLNSYGTRVLTDGMDIEQYKRNPVLLYMHQRGTVIGYMKDIKKEGDDVTGEPVFDEASELSQRCKNQWEFGSLKMVSAGLEIIEMSDEDKLLVVGQTSPTITKSKLYEVSIVDIGANDDALVLMREGKQITMGRDGENPLPAINIETMAKEKEKEEKAAVMEHEAAQVQAVKAAPKKEESELEKENAELKKEIAELRKGRIVTLVDRAIEERKIDKDKREQFVDLGNKIGEKELGEEELGEVFAAMSRRVSLSEMIHTSGDETAQEMSLKKMSEKEIERLRESDRERYARLYKAEYGMEPDMD